MPKIEVTRPIEISVGGRKTRLAPGFYDLSDDDMQFWYIPGLLQAGDIKAFVKEADKPQGKLMYGDVKITLGEGGKRVVQEVKTPPVAPQVPPEKAIVPEPKESSDKPAKAKLKRS